MQVLFFHFLGLAATIGIAIDREIGFFVAAMYDGQLSLEFGADRLAGSLRQISPGSWHSELGQFKEFGKDTAILPSGFCAPGQLDPVPVFVNEFWTARQRAAHSLHEVSYRACFKPALPRFFIDRCTEPGDRVYDPFMGRGTTLLEAALRGRQPLGCDINPLSVFLLRPRLAPPSLTEISQRLKTIPFDQPGEMPEDLLVFYHPETLRQISSLRQYLMQRDESGSLDAVDDWIRMVAINRLTGHSTGFFSVYSLPPNQAVSVKSQRKINADRNQVPPRREVPKLILKKSRQLLADLVSGSALPALREKAQLITGPAASTPSIESGSVQLVVTSPPFLNVVDYATDNWLRCWFAGIDAASVALTVPGDTGVWQEAMTQVFRELRRVLKPGGFVAFEVGEVKNGTVRLEDYVLPAGTDAGLSPILVLINDQVFTKTANCWGVDNLKKGTNTNRVVLFTKIP